RLGPPAIQDTEVKYTVHSGLHTRGSAGFLGPAWVVKPYIGAAYKHRTDSHVVILKKDNGIRVLTRKRNYVFNDALTAVVEWVRLSGKDNLKFSALKQTINFRAITKNKVTAFVWHRPS